MNKRVFVASTVYDLIDVRAEVERLLADSGLSPIMSDSTTSDFVVPPDVNSMETCLVNLRSADHVIVILSQRYGPSLKASGFDDLSATHLEYREARALGKPLHFYVRDRLASDFTIWRRNRRRPGIVLPWVKSEKDYRIFQFIEEHQELRADKENNNWLCTFRSTVDLKQCIGRDLRIQIAEAQIAQAIANNQVPVVHVTTTVSNVGIGCQAIFSFYNCGTTPAYNMRWTTEDEEGLVPVLAPGASFVYNIPFTGRPHIEKSVRLVYQMGIGHEIVDEFVIGVEVDNITHGENKAFVRHDTHQYLAVATPPLSLIGDAQRNVASV